MSVEKRSFILSNESVRVNAQLVISNLPVDGTIELVIRPYKRKRRAEANNLYWLRLAEIADQGWILGKRYSAEAWAEMFKEKYLPEGATEGETMENYTKWVELPDGTRRMVGSTTRLTTTGFANYLTQIEAFGAHELGVHFSANVQ